MNAVTSGNLIIGNDLNINEIQEFDMKIEKTAIPLPGSQDLCWMKQESLRS